MNKLPNIESYIALFDYRGLVRCEVYHLKKFITINEFANLKPFPKIMFQQIINVFRQLSPSELQHSRIICDLLNPDNHLIGDYGKQFLELFFKYVLDDDQFEYNEDDEWEVTAEEERYDIRIRNKDNSKIIIIENKSNWASDQPNQLYRYWNEGIYSKQKNIEKKYAKILYLSPSDSKRYSKQSITNPDCIPELRDNDCVSEFIAQVDETIIKTVFFNKEMVIWLDKCIEIVCERDDLYYYLLQYKDFWGNIMANEIVKQVEAHFAEKEQWDAFIELSNQRGTLLTSWYSTLRDALNKCFLTEKVDDAWGFETWGGNNWDYCWFLNGYGKEYVNIWLLQQNLHLRINPAKMDLPKATSLLKTAKYSKILAAFERQQEPYLEDTHKDVKMVERGNFYFGDTDDGHISIEKFAWYAHYRTDAVVEQILKKIDRFRESEVTTLIKELIMETKL